MLQMILIMTIPPEFTASFAQVDGVQQWVDDQKTDFQLKLTKNNELAVS